MEHERRASVRIRPREFVVDGLTTRAWSTAGTGRTFVLVHGIGMSHRYFLRLHRLLAATGAEVHSVDLPGFGGMPRPRRDLDIAAMADILAATARSLDVREPVILVGQSMGAQWVIEAAVRHPDLVEGVVLIGPVVDARRRNVWVQSADLALDTLRESIDANALVFADYVRCGMRWYLRQLPHMLSYRIEDAVATVTVPLLVLRGSKDPVARSDWTRDVRAAAHAGSHVIVPGHAHNVQHTAPRAVAGAIEAFCAALGSGR